MKVYMKIVMIAESGYIATSKNLTLKSKKFPHHSIHEYTWTSPEWKTHNQIDRSLIYRHLSVLEIQSFRAADCDTDRCQVVAVS
jgi:tRNA splicing endonuclease